MWRKPKDPAATEHVSRNDQAKPYLGPRALSSRNELLLQSSWETVGENERTALTGAFKPFPAPTSSDISNSPPDIQSSDLQDWVADLVGRTFQNEAAQILYSWLQDSSPEA